MLTGPEIKRQIALGKIKIEPLGGKINPNSVNLRLSDKLLVYEKAYHLHLEWDRELKEQLEYEKVAKKPSISRNLYLQSDYRRMIEPLDMMVEEKTVELKIPPEGLVLWPGVLYIGSTVEYTETPYHVPCIEGRSGIGRLGIMVHVTAGFGDVGFKGDWTLEMVVVHPIRVYAGIDICQIAYAWPDGEIETYKGHYQGQRGPKPSNVWKDFVPKQG